MRFICHPKARSTAFSPVSQSRNMRRIKSANNSIAYWLTLAFFQNIPEVFPAPNPVCAGVRECARCAP
jgi:hypothetical protein